jgi:AraC-like DNA-binding protein
MTLFIKNMVCRRCILSVEQILTDLGISFSAVRLGEIDVTHNETAEKTAALQNRLEAIGFELLDNQRQVLIEKIKNTIIELVYQTTDDASKLNLSDVLSQRLLKHYTALSTAFSEVEGTTIEQYYIAQKIERAKELLVYDELTLSEIAFRLGYSSVAHLSNQFKKVTGLTPTHFKSIGAARRRPIETI